MWVPEYKIFVVVVVGFELIKRMYDYFQSGYPGNEKTNLFYFGSNRTGQDLFQQQNVVLHQGFTF